MDAIDGSAFLANVSITDQQPTTFQYFIPESQIEDSTFRLEWAAEHGSGDNYSLDRTSWAPDTGGNAWGNYTNELKGDFKFSWTIHRDSDHSNYEINEQKSMSFKFGFVMNKDGSDMNLAEFKTDWVMAYLRIHSPHTEQVIKTSTLTHQPILQISTGGRTVLLFCSHRSR